MRGERRGSLLLAASPAWNFFFLFFFPVRAERPSDAAAAAVKGNVSEGVVTVELPVKQTTHGEAPSDSLLLRFYSVFFFFSSPNVNQFITSVSAGSVCQNRLRRRRRWRRWRRRRRWRRDRPLPGGCQAAAGPSAESSAKSVKVPGSSGASGQKSSQNDF